MHRARAPLLAISMTTLTIKTAKFAHLIPASRAQTMPRAWYALATKIRTTRA